jgi:Sulfotransferase family
MCAPSTTTNRTVRGRRSSQWCRTLVLTTTLFAYLFLATAWTHRDYVESVIELEIKAAAAEYSPTMALLFFEDQRRESLQYVQSIRSFRRTLLFVHVPKTAGTTMEIAVAGRAGISWGMCLMRDMPDCPEQPSVDTIRRRPRIQIHFGEWHIPPHFWPLSLVAQQRGYNNYDPSDGSSSSSHWWENDPYSAAELFTVVRDPIERQISDYHYFCHVVYGKNEALCNSANEMNAFLRERLKPKPSATEDYIRDGGHWIPAYDYVMRPNEIRQVDYLLQMDDDDLPRNFDRLAAAFELPLRFPESKENEGQYRLSRADLHPDVLKQLQTRFHNDYELLTGRQRSKRNV